MNTFLILIVVAAFLCVGAGVVLQYTPKQDNASVLARLNAYAGRAGGQP